MSRKFRKLDVTCFFEWNACFYVSQLFGHIFHGHITLCWCFTAGFICLSVVSHDVSWKTLDFIKSKKLSKLENNLTWKLIILQLLVILYLNPNEINNDWNTKTSIKRHAACSVGDGGAAVAVLGALFGVTGLRVAQLIDDSVHWWPSLGVRGPGPSRGSVRHGTVIMRFSTLFFLFCFVLTEEISVCCGNLSMGAADGADFISAFCLVL